MTLQNSEKYMRITLDGLHHLVTRLLTEEEVDWAKCELSHLEKKGVLLRG